MNEYEMIDKKIEQILTNMGDEKYGFIIYPFGRNGVLAKQLLNMKYGISESAVVDNRLKGIIPFVKTPDEVDDDGCVWLITCKDTRIQREILNSLQGKVSADKIYPIFAPYRPYGDKFNLISHIGEPDMISISSPCNEFLALVQKGKNERKRLTVAEIGIGIGASSVEVCRLLDEGDTYYGFDFKEQIDALIGDLKKLPEITCQLIGVGNSRKLQDSYNWKLCDMLFKMRNDGRNGLFDIVYLDGAHSFLHDGLACCLIKEMVKANGYIIFDDMFWKHKTWYENNPSERSYILDWFTEEQLEERQIERVVAAFMLHDERWECVNNTFCPARAIFKKH